MYSIEFTQFDHNGQLAWLLAHMDCHCCGREIGTEKPSLKRRTSEVGEVEGNDNKASRPPTCTNRSKHAPKILFCAQLMTGTRPEFLASDLRPLFAR